MYLSYSGYKKFRDCARSYYHAYIAKTKPPTPDNRVGMLYGQTVGVLFEVFYADKLWKEADPEAELRRGAEPTLKKTIATETSRGGILDWKASKKMKDYECEADILSDVLDTIPRGLEIIRQHRLLGADAVAEDRLDSDIQGHRFGGRADFVMRRAAPHGDRVILDGKGSKHRDKYTDVRQLHWYGLLHERKYGALPDKVAFIFWRSEPDVAVDWHTVTPAEVANLQSQVIEAMSEIEAATKVRLPVAGAGFAANPSEGNCRFCSYSFTCPEGQVMLSKDRPQYSEAEGVEEVGSK
jgi:hypothetical protein